MMKRALIILIGLFALLIITILSIPRLIDWKKRRRPTNRRPPRAAPLKSLRGLIGQ